MHILRNVSSASRRRCPSLHESTIFFFFQKIFLLLCLSLSLCTYRRAPIGITRVSSCLTLQERETCEWLCTVACRLPHYQLRLCTTVHRSYPADHLFCRLSKIGDRVSDWRNVCSEHIMPTAFMPAFFVGRVVVGEAMQMRLSRASKACGGHVALQ